MSRQQTSIKQSALGWVKKSIDDNLSEISTDLRLYIEEDDGTLLGAVQERLGVIQGVLTMVEQYGSAMLTEEMVSLCEFIAESKKDKEGQAVEVLLRAVLQLPDYLEHIQSGYRDIPIAILPLLNDIRAVKNQDLFSEKLLFLPDLSMHKEGGEDASIDDKSNEVSKLLARKLRPIFQFALLNLIRDKSVEDSLAHLEKVCETLEERSASEQVARIWWIVGALVESVARQNLELGVSIKSLLGKVDALFRVILIIGERGLLNRQPIELIKNFLFYIAQPECDGPKSQAIKTAYRLEEFLPSEAVRSKVLDNIAGPNQALLKTVAEAMKADIETVKSSLEVYVNGDLGKIELLRDIPQEMHVIADTLAMIGLGQQRQLIVSQIDVVKEIIDGREQPNEDKLLSMAAELIQVEQALDQMQKRQPINGGDERSEADVSRDFELDAVLTAVVTAALDNIQKTKSAILDFIKDPTRAENIDLCVTLMEEAKGALELLNQPRAVLVIDGLIRYLKEHDIVEFMDTNRLDSLSQVVVSIEYYLEALGEHRSDADSILDFADAQIKTLLSNATLPSESAAGEALLILDEQTRDTDESSGLVEVSALEIDDAPDLELEAEFVQLTDQEAPVEANGSLTLEAPAEEPVPVIAAELAVDSEIEIPSSKPISQGSEALPGDEQLVDKLSDELIDIHDALEEPAKDDTKVDVTGEDQSEFESPVEESVDKAVNVVPVDEALPVLGPDTDTEILEIYLEEAEEESENIRRLQQDWLLHPEDENAVTNIRRAFHTIKGSGRLVSASKIAEFAWDYEQLLNRVIDKTVLPKTDVIDAVGQAAAALAELVVELKTNQPPTADIPYLRGLARALAEFKAAQVLSEHTRQMEAIRESPHDLITDGPASAADDFEPIEPEALDDEAPVAKSESEETPPDPFVLTKEKPMPGEEARANTPDVQEPVEPTGLSFDPELLTIYQQEVEQHLSTINTALEEAEKRQELIPQEDLYRALHTIHGASRTADIGSIGMLAGLMEKPLKSALAQSMALDNEIITLYRQGYQALQSLTSELVETRQVPPIPEDLKISFQALAEDLEEHTVEIADDSDQPSGDFVDTMRLMSGAPDQEQDKELLAIFIDEANELLEMSDHTLHDWADQQADENGGHDFAAVMELQRYLHTLKGGAKMAELKEISDLSHEIESVFIAVIDTRVEKNDKLIELLENSFDLLHKQIGETQKRQPVTGSGDQVALLKAIRSGTGEDRSEPGLAVESHLDNENIDIVQENLDYAPNSATERSVQEVIRVRADLLDNLVNSAGEVSIYRARMEQQVAGLGSYLGELGQTITRLKNQLRSLESETDAQIHFSHRISAESADEFDPLELDRYTMIQELSRSLSESVSDLSSLQGMLGEQVKESETLLLQQSRVNTDLQDGLIKSRMVKFSGLLTRLRRLVRQSSQELAKKAELVVTGEENEIDSKVIDRMVAPLEHIIRNAISHGIEKPVDRVRKGKSETGRISIDISRDGSDIVIKVSDDGAGINLDKVRSRALQLGLLEHDQPASDSDLVQFILEPGFSTAEHITQLYGRGVGLEVVDIGIKELGGTLIIETSPQGSSFIARLPFTLSINQALLVRAGEEIYAIPLISIEGITRLETYKLAELYKTEQPELEYAGQNFSLHYLSKLVDAEERFIAGDDQSKQPVILSRSGDARLALHVDELLGNREVVAKSLGKQLSQVKGLSGASILADGSVVLILDINGLVRHGSGGSVKVIYKGVPEDGTQMISSARNTVMVVDDSITMRRVASKLLTRHNYRVVTAKDGVDALAQLEDVSPDVMLLDIEMPRMDGFELARHMQNEASYSKIPIIMITSRTGEKHRDRAFEIGVANYMGKPYLEEELLENIQLALGGN
ncbi:MAG: Hpt domain-containing protein [Gammaproteobacteria bacterium]